MAWWTMPALTVGAMYLVKRKGKAGKFRWVELTKADVSRAPISLIMAQISSGPELPEPPAGTTWKPMEIAIAPSPFAAVQEVTIHILEKWVPLDPRHESPDPMAGGHGMVGLGQPWRPRRVMHRKKPYWAQPTATYRPTPKPSPPRAMTTRPRWRPQSSVRPMRRPSRQQIIGPSALPKHQQQFEWTGPNAPYTPGSAPMRRGPSVWSRPRRPSVMPGWGRSVPFWGAGTSASPSMFVAGLEGG